MHGKCGRSNDTKLGQVKQRNQEGRTENIPNLLMAHAYSDGKADMAFGGDEWQEEPVFCSSRGKELGILAGRGFHTGSLGSQAFSISQGGGWL